MVISRNADEMKQHAESFDFILDCVAADHDINAYLELLKPDSVLVLVGAPALVTAAAARPGERFSGLADKLAGAT